MADTRPGIRSRRFVGPATSELAARASDPLRYAPILTPLGQLYVAYRGDAVCATALGSGARGFERACRKEFGSRPLRTGRLPEGLARQVLNYLTGQRRFSAPVDLSGLTPFQRLVLTKTMEIPAGEVRSYRWVAKEIGAERAARAVGTALARNPIPFLIPCHRVVRTDGRIGHYSGGGPSTKAKILALEGVDVEALERLATRRIRFVGSDTGKVFCHASCHRARSISHPDLVYFASKEEAVREGYCPCRHCRPA